MALLGMSVLLEGIYHDFVEPLGQAVRFPLKLSNWIVLGLVTFCLLSTTSHQFSPYKLHSAVYAVDGTQLVAYAIFVFVVGRFLVVILNYAPVMLLLLACSLRGLRD